MKKTIDGVEFDTEHAELIANHDADDNSVSAYLYRTSERKYFLRTERLQMQKGRTWHPAPMDGSAKGHKARIAEEIIGLTENQAIDWFVANLVPKCFATSIQEQLGQLVSFDLGELAEPLARYCKDKGVTNEQALERALRDYTQPAHVTETEKAIVHLQDAVAKRFGRDFGTDSGAGTLYISHDGVSLTNHHSSIVAQRASSIARQLTVARVSCSVDARVSCSVE